MAPAPRRTERMTEVRMSLWSMIAYIVTGWWFFVVLGVWSVVKNLVLEQGL